MKRLSIDWLNHCLCCQNNDYAIVVTEKGKLDYLYDGDYVECPDCGNTGIIECHEHCAFVAWEGE